MGTFSLVDRKHANRMDHVHYLFLALLVLFGAGLRFYRIEIPGFTEGADYMYAKTARTMALLFTWGWQHLDLLGDPLVVSQQLQLFFAHLEHQPSMPYSCKPAYDFINVFLITCLGYEDWVLSVSSALAGVLALGAIFMLTAHQYGPRVGLVAVALLSASGGGLVLSRFGQAHMWSIVFFMVGFLSYRRSLNGPDARCWLIWAAIFMGLTLATHPNMVPYVGSLALVGEASLFFRQRRGIRDMVIRAALGGGSVLGILLALNLPFVLLGHFAGSFFDQVEAQMTWPFMTYLDQLPHHFGMVFDKGQTPGFAERFYTYIIVLWAWEGLPLLCLVGLGFAWGVSRLALLDLFECLLIGQISIPLLFWLCTENQAVYRFSAGALPSLLIVAARTLDGLVVRLAWRVRLPESWLIVVLCSLVLGYNTQANRVLYQAQSAHKLAAAWLQTQGEQRIAVHHPISWRFYGIEPVDLTDDIDRVRYIAFYRRYMTVEERAMLSSAGVPAKVYKHQRPGKLLEVNLMQGSMVLKLLEYVPGLGRYIAQMREKIMFRNDLRRLEIYEIDAGVGKILTQN